MRCGRPWINKAGEPPLSVLKKNCDTAKKNLDEAAASAGLTEVIFMGYQAEPTGICPSSPLPQGYQVRFFLRAKRMVTPAVSPMTDNMTMD